MDKQREDEICKIFEDIVKKHPDATAEEGSLPDDMRFIPLELWQAAQTAMQPEIDRLKNNQCSGHFRIGCSYMSGCNTICNKCGHVHNADTGLAYVQQLTAANQRNKELQSENETCRNLMRIKQEQNDAFNQRIAELEAIIKASQEQEPSWYLSYEFKNGLAYPEVALDQFDADDIPLYASPIIPLKGEVR